MRAPSAQALLPERYLEEAAHPEVAEDVTRRLPALLARLGERTRVVRLARDAYGYATDPAVPTRYKILGFAALLYLLHPVDAVPDVIPVVGYADDAAALTAFVVAVRKVVAVAREAAKDVVTHAVAETQAAVATRGLAQVALTLWTATLAASIGLVYAGARAVIGAPGASVLADPFAAACLVSALVGLVVTADAARRVRGVYRRLPVPTRDRLLRAVATEVTGRRVALLAAPVVALAVVVGIRVALALV